MAGDNDNGVSFTEIQIAEDAVAKEFLEEES